MSVAASAAKSAFRAHTCLRLDFAAASASLTGVRIDRKLGLTHRKGFRGPSLGWQCGQKNGPSKGPGEGGKSMRRSLLILGLLALAVGLLWVGQGTGMAAWPQTSFM